MGKGKKFFLCLGILVLGKVFYDRITSMRKQIKSLQGDVAHLYSHVNILSNIAKYKDPGMHMQSELQERGLSRIAVYGVGWMGALVAKRLEESDIQIAYFIDAGGKLEKFGERIVYSLDNLSDAEPVDAIVVTPVYDYKSICADLYLEGREEPILSLLDLLK